MLRREYTSDLRVLSAEANQKSPLYNSLQHQGDLLTELIDPWEGFPQVHTLSNQRALLIRALIMVSK